MIKQMVATAGLVLSLTASQGLAAIIVDLNGPEQSYTVQEIIDAGGIQVGDKLFDNWRVTGIDTNDPDGALHAGAIKVTGVLINGEYGIRVDGGWTATSGNTAGTTLGYRVSVTDPAMNIVGATLKITSGGALGDGSAGVTANLYDSDPNNSNPTPFSTSTVGAFVGSDPAWTIATGSFDNKSELWVVAGVVVNSPANGQGTLTEYYHTFAQAVIPEPASIALIFAGGMLMFGRRRH